MNTIQWIEKEQPPEAHHRQKMAIYRPPGTGRYYEVENGQSQWSNKQSDCIVNPQPTERRSGGSRDHFGDNIAHRVGQQGKDQSTNYVPAGNVQIFESPTEKCGKELDCCQN